jgi:hypothetical protein
VSLFARLPEWKRRQFARRVFEAVTKGGCDGKAELAAD